jgi:formylglycine-generating enzyme required for sulfatase activity
VALCLFGVLLSAFAAAQSPGTVFRDCDVCPAMTVVPAGSFVMGDEAGDPAERPAHRVAIARPFAIGRTEVTFAEWEACAAEGACRADPDDHGWGKGRRPVINVTFADIEDYLRWLSVRSGRCYRLPSEAEWEYAARAGTVTAYWWGNAAGKGNANCRHCGAPFSGTESAPVASLPANPWGLYDTAGNVWDWVADCWNESHAGAHAGASPRLSGDCSHRVVRGGAWYYIPRLARSAARARNHVDVHSYAVGFRVAREVE